MKLGGYRKWARLILFLLLPVVEYGLLGFSLEFGMEFGAPKKKKNKIVVLQGKAALTEFSNLGGTSGVGK